MFLTKEILWDGTTSPTPLWMLWLVYNRFARELPYKAGFGGNLALQASQIWLKEWVAVNLRRHNAHTRFMSTSVKTCGLGGMDSPIESAYALQSGKVSKVLRLLGRYLASSTGNADPCVRRARCSRMLHRTIRRTGGMANSHKGHLQVHLVWVSCMNGKRPANPIFK